MNFTAAVTPTNATGTIQFFTNGAAFDAGIARGRAGRQHQSCLLPRGTNLITAIYSGDANDLPATNSLAQIVTNHPPVAARRFTPTATSVLPLDIRDRQPRHQLERRGWRHRFAGRRQRQHQWRERHGTTAGVLVYSNSNNVADQFTCTITDGWGGTNFQTVNIAAVPLPNDARPASSAWRRTGNGV